MRGFLREVAEDLYARYGGGVSELTVLFPSRRARVFFSDALAQVADRPLWQPAWMTIDELMAEASGLRPGDRLRLITELYEVYSQHHAETFDKFYFWGEMLLTDFDTIDKYRVDADMLFRNVEEIKELEADISYLTPAQLKILSFWSAFGEGTELSDEKRKFLAIWRSLRTIYHQYRERLTALGIAYNGMMQREAAERMREPGFALAPRRYVVAGFNALTECEKLLFKHLAATAPTDFYWDYDDYYKDNSEQEAGMFVRDNVAMFPPQGGISHDNFARPKELTAVAAVSDAVQCKYAAEILRELADGGTLGTETAVVLTDENLLLPLLYALPPEAGKVNVTMGYPLRQSLAYSFVERLVELQSRRRDGKEGSTFYHVDVTGLLAHPYVSEGNPKLTRGLLDGIVADRRIRVSAGELAADGLLGLIFSPAASWRELSDYLLAVLAEVARRPYEGDDAKRRIEFLAVLSEEIAKLRNSLDACDIELTSEVYNSLLRRHLQGLRIPFEGEPLEGIQVMGILETRNLDFENVVILSMNDDNFPGSHTSQASFVPYNLRAAYGLPTPEHHEGVYAYYFYRLIQRARKVKMLYCAHADEKSTGEPSRYIRQLDYESGIPIRRIEAGVDVNLAQAAPIEVAKDARVMERLGRFLEGGGGALSPTAFFRYVACPLRFYFHSVARLEAKDELSEEVDAPMFGTILHAAAQSLYGRIEGAEHPGAALEALRRSGEAERAVVAAINKDYLRREGADDEEYGGNLLLVKRIVTRYLEGGVMAYDAAHDTFAVTGLEEKVEGTFEFESAGKKLKAQFFGVADRIDSLDGGMLRVVDYKTGTPHLEFAGVESLFRGEGKQRLSNILQTLLYAMMLHHKRGRDVVPALYYVRNMHIEGYSPLLDDRERKQCGVPYSAYAGVFEPLLAATLGELFDAAVPFRQCEDPNTCQFCDFQEICKR